MRQRRSHYDRRVVFLTLTGEGRALTLNQRMQTHDATLSQGIREVEMTVFVSVISRMMDNCGLLAQANLALLLTFSTRRSGTRNLIWRPARRVILGLLIYVVKQETGHDTFR